MQKSQSLIPDTVVVTEISLDDYEAHWLEGQYFRQDVGPFVSPAWLRAWWLCFGEKKKLLLLRISSEKEMLGLAPLMVERNTAKLIGSADLCDYIDFPVLPGHGEEFFNALVYYLKRKGISRLILQRFRPDSSVVKSLIPLARDRGCETVITPENVSLRMSLPASWDEYLMMLDGKQRHEVRRKLRRFHEAGSVAIRNIREPGEIARTMPIFFKMFRQSRKDKESFLTSVRQRFFQELASRLAHAAMLDIMEININGSGVAMVFCVNLGSTTYLYNNGFNPEYRALSVGVVSKLLTIRRSIENGMRHYDFLGGGEQYKYRLGGKEETLFSCCLRLQS